MDDFLAGLPPEARARLFEIVEHTEMNAPHGDVDALLAALAEIRAITHEHLN